MKKLFAVFSLSDAVCGISNAGIERDGYAYTLSQYGLGVFDTEKECEEHIKTTMEDYRRRRVGDNSRFVVLPVFCFEEDDIFKTEL